MMTLAETANALARDETLRQHALHAYQGDALELARALKALYIEAISSDPLLATGASATLAALAEHHGGAELRALASWVAGMAALQIEGQFEPAIALIDQAAQQFEQLGLELDAAATQPSKLYALALLGRYDEAIAVGQRARDVLLAHGDILAAGKIEQNLGNLHHRRNHYAEAERAYRTARDLFAASGDQRMLAFAENGLANVLTMRHHLHEAGALYQQALARATAAHADVTCAEIECNLGYLALLQGNYDQALDYLERSRRHYAALDMPHESVLAELEMADAYLELNLLPEAAAIYQRAQATLADLGMRAELAHAQANHARAAIGLGQFEAARELLAGAQAIYGEESNQVGAALAQLSSAHILYAEGSLAGAAEAAAGAEELLTSASAWNAMLGARWLYGDALRAQGQYPQAQAVLESTAADAKQNALPAIELQALTSLGQIAAQENRPDLAETRFRQAVALIEAMRAPLPVEEFRSAFLSNKLVPYTELVRLCLAAPGGGREAEAFNYVEQSRSRALFDTLHGETTLQQPPRNAAEAALVEQLATARQELNSYYSRIYRFATSEDIPDEHTLVDLHQRSQEHEQRIETISRQLAQLGRRPAQAGEAFELALLQRQLDNTTTLIEYFHLDSELIAFVITRHSLQVVRGLASEPDTTAALEKLRFQLDTLRFGSGIQPTAQLTSRANSYLHHLYKHLVAPLVPLLAGQNLVFVAHGTLHYVPFHALFDGEHYLIERYTVSYTPSAHIYLGQSSPPTPIRSALLVGVPDARTPYLGEEIGMLAPLFEHTTTLLGEEATTSALQTNAAGADLIHLACHGQFRSDRPLFSALQLADGHFTVRDIYTLNLQSQLVVLSACETGVNTIAPGDELLGLTRGFFAAGTCALLVSLWPVDDRSTTELMQVLYQHLLAGESPAQALQLAQQTMMARHSHPFFWAPFVLIGRQ